MHDTLGVPIVICQLSEGWNFLTGKQSNSVQQRIAAISEHRLDDQVALAGVVDEPGYIACKPVQWIRWRLWRRCNVCDHMDLQCSMFVAEDMPDAAPDMANNMTCI